ncbi:MAG: hypothetical protein KF830_12720 [Planctomycetes bacterium]|nr:hypothetical protein [Planctomycetota bacterium]
MSELSQGNAVAPSQDERRLPRTVLASCLLLALACMLLGIMMVPAHHPYPSPIRLPTASDNEALRRLGADDSHGTPSRRRDADGATDVTLQISDAVSGSSIDDVAVFRTVRPMKFRAMGDDPPLAHSKSGLVVLTLDTHPDAEPTLSLWLQHPDYLPLTLADLRPGMHRVAMIRGRKITVAAVDPDGVPVPQVMVVAFRHNFDRRLGHDIAPSQGACAAAPDQDQPWYAAAMTDQNGNATLLTPCSGIRVTVSALGWFTSANHHDVAAGADPVASLRVVVHPVRCRAMTSAGARILGHSLPEVSPGWTPATNAQAFAAAAAVRSVLSEQFPGALVIADCLVRTRQRRGGPLAHDSPQAHLSVMLDRVGAIDVSTSLLTLRDHQVQTIAVSATATTGILAVSRVPGFPPTRQSPLLAVCEDGGRRRPISLDLDYGSTYCVAPGTYRVLQRCLGTVGKQEIGLFHVAPNSRADVDVQGDQVAWPITLRVLDEEDRSPRWCTLRIRRVDKPERLDFRSSPSETHDVLAFLRPGNYEVMASADGSKWHARSLTVGFAASIVDLACPW